MGKMSMIYTSIHVLGAFAIGVVVGFIYGCICDK